LQNSPKIKGLLPLVVVLAAGVPAFGQSASYSFDNFDTAHGVRVYVEPPKVQPAALNKASKTNRQKSAITGTTNNSNERPATVKLTSLTFDAIAIGNQSLRGYTTGSAQVDQYLAESAQRNGVDPLLLYSIMHQESTFKRYAVSPKGARGLMQLMPFTAVRYGVTNIFDPKQNIEGGARYMRFLLDHFDGDVNLALAGYNAGEGAVEKYGWRIPPYSETQEYVRRISRRYAILRDPNAALYASSLSGAQLARLQNQQSQPLSVYERTVSSVRLPDGRLQLMSQ
jgi:soluble lytic murein transglycosylase-like protein